MTNDVPFRRLQYVFAIVACAAAILAAALMLIAFAIVISPDLRGNPEVTARAGSISLVVMLLFVVLARHAHRLQTIWRRMYHGPNPTAPSMQQPAQATSWNKTRLSWMIIALAADRFRR